MLTKLTLAAALAGLLLQVDAVKQPILAAAAPQKINVILCKTEAQAVAFAAARSAGKTEPIAINLVNKASGAEVCGRYIGYAVVETEKTANHGGTLFMLASMRFVEDGALAWTASWIAPFQGAQLERGT
jgi:hypothetical protein